MFNRLDHLYIGHAGGSSREKGFNKIFSCVSRGLVSNDMTRHVKGPEFDYGQNLLLFAS